MRAGGAQSAGRWPGSQAQVTSLTLAPAQAQWSQMTSELRLRMMKRAEPPLRGIGTLLTHAELTHHSCAWCGACLGCMKVSQDCCQGLTPDARKACTWHDRLNPEEDP